MVIEADAVAVIIEVNQTINFYFIMIKIIKQIIIVKDLLLNFMIMVEHY